MYISDDVFEEQNFIEQLVTIFTMVPFSLRFNAKSYYLVV